MEKYEVATLIGDLVDSRLAGDRKGLQQGLAATLRQIGDEADRFEWTQKPAVTVGDEFQAVLPEMRTAVSASLHIRLELFRATGVDSRFGIGWGEIYVFDATRTPISQDGPGWWAARQAINGVASMADQKRRSFVRTRVAGEQAGGEIRALNAYLLMRDSIIDAMKPATRRYLLGTLNGYSQEVIAKNENVSQSNVSQVLSRSGADAIISAERELME